MACKRASLLCIFDLPMKVNLAGRIFVVNALIMTSNSCFNFFFGDLDKHHQFPNLVDVNYNRLISQVFPFNVLLSFVLNYTWFVLTFIHFSGVHPIRCVPKSSQHL